MANWEYTFKPVPKSEWIRQIEKDLGAKTIDSLNTEWWPGEFISPMHHQEDIKGSFVALPDHYFSQPPLITEWIDTRHHPPDAINSKVIQSLNYGVQSIILDAQNLSENQYDLWLKDVYPDMIDISVNFSESIFETNLFENNNPNINIRIPGSKDLSLPVRQIETFESNKFKSFRFVYDVPISGNWIEAVVDVFKRIKNDMTNPEIKKKDDVSFLKKCILLITPDSNYIKNLIQLRVLQLLWLNFTRLHFNSDEPLPSPVECHIAGTDPLSPDDHLIRASSIAMSVALTGAHSLCIHDQENVPEFYSRINRNIHHLLNLESEIYTGKDPLAGSYAIDYYTERWTKAIWDKISND